MTQVPKAHGSGAQFVKSATASAQLEDGTCSLHRRRTSATTDDLMADQALEALGYKPELSRSRSTLQVAFMSFVLASIPYGLATTLYYPLIGGGPVNIIWGWLGVSVIIVCVAASLGEITSVYPTAGGTCYFPPDFLLVPFHSTTHPSGSGTPESLSRLFSFFLFFSWHA